MLVPCSHTQGILTENTHGSLLESFLEPQEHTLLAGRWMQAGLLRMRKAPTMNSQPISGRNWWIKGAAPLLLSGTAQKHVLYPLPEDSKGTEHQLPTEVVCLFTIPTYWLPSLSCHPSLIPHSNQYCLGLSPKESLLSQGLLLGECNLRQPLKI